MDDHTDWFFMNGGLIHVCDIDFSDEDIETMIDNGSLIPAYKNDDGHWLEIGE